MNLIRRIACGWILLSAVMVAAAQDFFNLTAEAVRIDSVLPVFTHQIDLGVHYADSLYEVSIDYPEFIDMHAADVARCQRLVSEPLPALPKVEQYISVDRKRGMLCIRFVPLVFRDGKYQKLVSFKLTVHAEAVAHARKQVEEAQNSRYAAHSVLASGTWAKICVPSTGIYELSDALVRKAGFSSAANVKIYGYGGALQPESLTEDYLTSTDDLKEVPICVLGGKRLFRAVGPVSWKSATEVQRTRNYCSDYGYYFLTESEGEPLQQDSATFVGSFYPSADDYHSLYEDDEYAWYHSGRNLYAKEPLSMNSAKSYTLEATDNEGTLAVAMSYDGYCSASVSLNDSVIGSIEVSYSSVASGVKYRDDYSVAASYVWRFPVTTLKNGTNTITLRQTSAGEGTTSMRLDYISLTQKNPKPLPDWNTTIFPSPTYVHHITRQDHHADSVVDMVIVIPTTQKWLSEAERLKTLHEQMDSMSVRIVPVDELYNEFSSGTPEVSAIRRYMKMMYDRSGTSRQQPHYLLLFGDGAYDNRMLTTEWRSCSPDDFLLCYESENSFSNTASYVSDDFYTLLDDGEIITNFRGKPDIAIGRLTARTVDEAKILVDKIVAYRNNVHAGAWQNTICVMADDGNNNNHMQDAEALVKVIENTPAYQIKKVYWDAYARETSATGNRYPVVEQILRQQLKDGALMMDYSGHGAAYCLSHEMVLKLEDFDLSSQSRLPLWITASCDIAPFDTQEDNIGERAMFNENGGAIAFLGTSRTVFMTQNRSINRAFVKQVLSCQSDGRLNTMGEALRLAKNELVDAGTDVSQNKLHYVLLGDPALRLAAPTLEVAVDSINGQAVDGTTKHLSAGAQVQVSGYVKGQPQFRGVMSVTVLDVEETIVCKLNAPESGSSVGPMTFKTRPNVIYSGSDSIRNGRFTFTFSLPKDISYSEESGQMLLYAVSSDGQMEGHGECENFVMDGDAQVLDDGVGPSIYCYLNSSSFSNGGTVNATPYFYAELSDKDGINAVGNGIGHNLELIIDGQQSLTYNLNDYFQYNFGDYQSGVIGYSIPTLSAGAHKLLFRAWDVLNNSSTAELSFVVDPTQEPSLFNVVCSRNPASSNTSFIITHDRTGSDVDVVLEIFDTSGRKLWEKSQNGVPTDQTYVVDWNLTMNSGSKLHAGIYLYRVLVSSNGSTQASLAKKLIVTGNK